VARVCVAAPILAPNGTAPAALSVSMPAGRLKPNQAAPAVHAAARALTRELNRGGRRNSSASVRG
jgi:DNA-binding IclR family transcriptional regulator